MIRFQNQNKIAIFALTIHFLLFTMLYLKLLPLLLLLSACHWRANTPAPQEAIAQDSLQNKGMRTVTDSEESISFQLLAEPTIHDNILLYQISVSYIDSNGEVFVSPSDFYEIDSLDLPIREMQKRLSQGKKIQQYIVLDDKYKKRIFEKTNYSPSDTIFVYNYEKNILKKYPITDLRTVAYIHINSDENKIDIKKCKIGFELAYDPDDISQEESRIYWEAYAYIGKENPFVENQMKPMAWVKVDKEKFPLPYTIIHEEYYWGNTYRYEDQEVICYLRDFHINEGYEKFHDKRYLVVLDAKTKRIIKTAFWEESELLVFDSPYDRDDLSFSISIGRLLKNRPITICGLNYRYFQCLPIVFLDQQYSDLNNFCDKWN